MIRDTLNAAYLLDAGAFDHHEFNDQEADYLQGNLRLARYFLTGK